MADNKNGKEAAAAASRQSTQSPIPRRSSSLQLDRHDLAVVTDLQDHMNAAFHTPSTEHNQPPPFSSPQPPLPANSTVFPRKSHADDGLLTVSQPPSPPRRSIDVYNTLARNKMSMLSSDANEGGQVPSLYANVRKPSNAAGLSAAASGTSLPGAGQSNGNISIEPRRLSDDSFVSALNVEITEKDRRANFGDSSFDIGRWTVRHSSTHQRPSMSGKAAAAPHSGRTSVAFSRAEAAMMLGEDDGLALHRITSEPVRGGRVVTAPFGNVLLRHDNEPLTDSGDWKQAVQNVGLYLDQRSREASKVTRAKDGQFWIAFFAIAVTGFLSAIDMTIIAPILPTIAADLPPSIISPTWINSGFLLTMTAFQPLWGGLSDALGRRAALMASLVLFIAGSIPCTVAKSMLTMVAGRGLQGVGGGGMLAVGEVMLSDITSLAERGYFLGLLSLAFALAAIAAPLLGGVFASLDGGLTWRWSFIINFPIGVLALLLLLCTRPMRTPKLTLREKWDRCDAPSAVLLFGATTSLLIGLTRGGQEYAWRDGRVLAPLVCGAVGLIAFFVVQWWPSPIPYLAPRPILDRTLFFGKGRRTAAIAYALTFFHGVMLYGAVQTLILYFETRNASPLRAAINVLPANVPSTPAAFLAGVLMAITGRYKTQIIVAQVLMLVGFGMFVYLDDTSPTYQWVIFQLIASLGIGAMYTLALPAIQASVPPAYLARATASFAFVRSLGAVWGVSATLIAFSAQAGRELSQVPGADAIGYTGATALGQTTSVKLITSPALQTAVRAALDRALRVAFAVLVPFAGLGLVLACFIRHVPLPNFNESEYGLKDEKPSNSGADGHRGNTLKTVEEGGILPLASSSPTIASNASPSHHNKTPNTSTPTLLESVPRSSLRSPKVSTASPPQPQVQPLRRSNSHWR